MLRPLDVAGDRSELLVVDLVRVEKRHQIRPHADRLRDLTRRRVEQRGRETSGHNPAAADDLMAASAVVGKCVQALAQVSPGGIDRRDLGTAERADVGDEVVDLRASERRLGSHRLVTGRVERHPPGREIEVGRSSTGSHERRPRAVNALRVEPVTGGAAVDEELAAVARVCRGGRLSRHQRQHRHNERRSHRPYASRASARRSSAFSHSQATNRRKPTMSSEPAAHMSAPAEC